MIPSTPSPLLVTTIDDLSEAHRLRTVLEEEGIPARVAEGQAFGVDALASLFPMPSLGYSVLVLRPADRDRAIEIVSEDAACSAERGTSIEDFDDSVGDPAADDGDDDDHEAQAEPDS